MINEKISKYLDPIKNFWNKLSKNTHKIIAVVFIGIVALAVVLSLLMNQTQFVVLYPGLDHDEAVEVMTELKDTGVSYKEDNGTIYVPSEQENSLRMQLSNEGHPKTAPNYDYFTNNINAMTTDYEKKVIEKYQLNQRLEAVIKTLEPIDSAYVTISVPDDSGYALDDNKESATASVTVKIGKGKTLSAKQVSGIKQLVSKSVPNLAVANVSVIDAASGVELSEKEDASSNATQMDLTQFKLKVEKQYEDSIQKKVLNVLVPQFGKDSVSVSVTSKMDLDKKIRDIITYQPATSDGKGIISKSNEETETATPSSAAQGAAGTQNNTDTASSGTETYPGVTLSGNTVTTKDSKTYEYLVSQIEEQIQSDTANLDDLTVSVLINAAAMTDQQRESIAASVAVAAGGLQPEKVNVRNGAFATAEVPADTKPAFTFPTLPVIIGGASALLLIILLIVFLAMRSRRKREELMKRLDMSLPAEAPMTEEAPEGLPGQEAENPVFEEFDATEEEPEEEPEEETGEETGEEDYEEEPEEYEEEEAEEDGQEGDFGIETEENEEGDEEDMDEQSETPTESIAEIRNSMDEKERKVKKDLQDFSTQNPEIVAQLIRSWLKGDDHRA